METLQTELQLLCESVATSLKKSDLTARTVTLKVKYADFVLNTRSRSLDEYVSTVQPILDVARELLAHTEAGAKKIRLLGVSVSNFG